MAERMSREDLIAYIGCGIHTGLRKALDSPEAVRAWEAIRDLPEGEWKVVLEYALQQVQRVVWKKER